MPTPVLSPLFHSSLFSSVQFAGSSSVHTDLKNLPLEITRQFVTCCKSFALHTPIEAQDLTKLSSTFSPSVLPSPASNRPSSKHPVSFSSTDVLPHAILSLESLRHPQPRSCKLLLNYSSPDLFHTKNHQSSCRSFSLGKYRQKLRQWFCTNLISIAALPGTLTTSLCAQSSRSSALLRKL